MKLSELNPKYRYKLCYWLDTVEYNVTVYKYNSKTKKYDIVVDKINGKKVTGKCEILQSSSPTIHPMWGY